MKPNYFERLGQFEILEDSRYQPLNMRLPEIKEEYDQLIENIINHQIERQNDKKEEPKKSGKKK